MTEPFTIDLSGEETPEELLAQADRADAHAASLREEAARWTALARGLRAQVRPASAALQANGLRSLRGARPQAMVADAVGVSQRSYQAWESGEFRPSYANLQKLAAYFEVDQERVLNAPAEGVLRLPSGLELTPADIDAIAAAMAVHAGRSAL